MREVRRDYRFSPKYIRGLVYKKTEHLKPTANQTKQQGLTKLSPHYKGPYSSRTASSKTSVSVEMSKKRRDTFFDNFYVGQYLWSLTDRTLHSQVIVKKYSSIVEPQILFSENKTKIFPTRGPNG